MKLPGDHFHSGFWPALWTMGNLGRAGYMQSTTGYWPYSYNTCGLGSEGQDWSKNRPQSLSACPDPPGFDRTKYGMAPGVGRGAPEFDIFEVRWAPQECPLYITRVLLKSWWCGLLSRAPHYSSGAGNPE